MVSVESSFCVNLVRVINVILVSKVLSASLVFVEIRL